MFRICLILSVLTFGCIAVDVSSNCTFIYSFNKYACKFAANGFADENDVTLIEGQHLPDYGDEQVERISAFMTSIAVMPTIVCEKFVNLQSIEFSASDMQTITENSFSKCLSLNFLRLSYNKLELRNNTELQSIILDYNDIDYIEDGTFRNLHKLIRLTLYYNKVTTLGRDFFQGLDNLGFFDLSKNPLQSVHPDILKNIPSYKMDLKLLNDDCINIDYTFTRKGVSYIKPFFKDCFANYAIDEPEAIKVNLSNLYGIISLALGIISIVVLCVVLGIYFYSSDCLRGYSRV